MFVRSPIRRFAPDPAVKIMNEHVVEWTEWAKGGGALVYCQDRLLASTLLHESPDDSVRVLFVLNHYFDAARFMVTLGVPAKSGWIWTATRRSN